MVEALKGEGIDVWFDRQGLYVGAQWVRTIEAEIQSRDVFVVVLTPDAWASHWVQQEISLALALKKRIVGIIHKPTALTGFILNYQLSDASHLSAEDTAAEVVATLKGAPSGSAATQRPSIRSAAVTPPKLHSLDGVWYSSGGNFKWRLSIKVIDDEVTGTAEREGPDGHNTLSLRGSASKMKFRAEKSLSEYSLLDLHGYPGSLIGHVVTYSPQHVWVDDNVAFTKH